jgi:hypothetical protein
MDADSESLLPCSPPELTEIRVISVILVLAEPVNLVGAAINKVTNRIKNRLSSFVFMVLSLFSRMILHA